MLEQLNRAAKMTALTALLGIASPSLAAITVLHSYDLEGTLGTAATNQADGAGSVNLSLNGTGLTTPTYVATATAGTGVDFANAGGNLGQFANNYYENTSGAVTLADRFNWGFEAVVTLNALPNIAGDVHGETAVLEIGTGGDRVILQTFNSTLGGGGTPVWMIHIAGLSLLTADPLGGGALVAGQEQHIAGVFNGTEWELYIDGTEVALTAAVGSTGSALSGSMTGIRIAGADNNGNVVRGLDGQVGAVRIFEFEAGQFDISDTLIPEPGSLALLGLGGLLLARRRRA